MIRTGKYLFALIICLMAVACASNRQAKQGITPPPEARMPEFILHRVLPGETMSSIAKWYTGKQGDWRELAKYNPDLKPRNLKPGDLVKIPLRMATAHTNPPEHSTAPVKRRKATRKTAHPRNKAPAEPEQVFGPK